MHLPNSIVSIGDLAFRNCVNIASVNIPSSVTEIGKGSFLHCYNLEKINVEFDNAIYDSRDNCNAVIETATNTLKFGCKSTIIPSSVTSIGESAFRDCSGLAAVEIPNSVTSIGESAFQGCSGLTSVEIPNSVTSISNYAFPRSI